MKIVIQTALAAGLLTLAACNSSPAEKAAENIEDLAENQADLIEEQADVAVNEVVEERLEEQADVVRDIGENRAEQ